MAEDVSGTHRTVQNRAVWHPSLCRVPHGILHIPLSKHFNNFLFHLNLLIHLKTKHSLESMVTLGCWCTPISLLMYYNFL